MRYCRQCGADMLENMQFCPECGAEFDNEKFSYDNHTDIYRNSHRKRRTAVHNRHIETGRKNKSGKYRKILAAVVGFLFLIMGVMTVPKMYSKAKAGPSDSISSHSVSISSAVLTPEPGSTTTPTPTPEEECAQSKAVTPVITPVPTPAPKTSEILRQTPTPSTIPALKQTEMTIPSPEPTPIELVLPDVILTIPEGFSFDGETHYELTAEEYRKLLNSVHERIQDNLTFMSGDLPHFDSILANEDCTEFTIVVNSIDTNADEQRIRDTLFIYGSIYAAYMDKEESPISIEYINRLGKVVKTEEYQTKSDAAAFRLIPSPPAEAAKALPDLIPAPEKPSSSTDGFTVYVSRNNVAHLRSTCSGMKYYTEMTWAEAKNRGARSCSKCW